MNRFLLSILFVIGLILPVGLAAQSNDIIDVFLSRSEADFGTSAYLVLASVGKISDSSSVDDAMNWILQSGQEGKFKNLDPQRSVSYGEFSYLLMEALNLKGGLMYHIFPGPRYAAREASYKKWIIGRSSPMRSLKPFEVMNALITVLEEEGV